MLKKTLNFFILTILAVSSVQTEMPQQKESSDLEKIMQKNNEKFDELRKLNLPLGKYAIISSGPLGIRNIREIGDIDLIVDVELWTTLAKQYEVIDKDGVQKIVFPGNIIEAFYEKSFYSYPQYQDAPTIGERIAQAEIIDGLPFESLPHVLYFKRKMGREKDLKDIKSIEAWLRHK
jgi:hypothetical protein